MILIQMMQAGTLGQRMQKPDSVVKYPDISCRIVKVQAGSEVGKVSRVCVHSNHLKQVEGKIVKSVCEQKFWLNFCPSNIKFQMFRLR